MDDSKATIILPHTLVLEDPFQLGTTHYSEFVFVRKPRAKALKNVPTSDERMQLGHFFPIIADMTGLAPVVIDELSMTDLTKCNEVAANFFGNTQETGETPKE